MKKPTPAMKADLMAPTPAPKPVKPYVRTADTKPKPAGKPARVPGNGLTATGNLTRPKTNGRVVGSKNRKQITEEMLGDILAVYQQLGGVRWLTRWAKANETEFIKQGLSRLFPTPPRDDDTPPIINNTINLQDPDAIKAAACRVAYALALAGQQLDQPAPVTPAPRWQPPEEVPYDPPASFADLQEQVQTQNTDELTRDTHTESLATYAGGAEQQGLKRKKPGA